MTATIDRVGEYKFSVTDYHRMAETGILPADARVELIEGKVVGMPPMGSRHAACLTRLYESLQDAARGRGTVRVRMPLVIDDHSEPEPDVAVVKARADAFASGHPGPDDALLLVEVSDTTLAFDLEVKVPLYARAGIREVWVVDLAAQAIISFRKPVGGRYSEEIRYGPGEPLNPGAFPDFALDPAALLD